MKKLLLQIGVIVGILCVIGAVCRAEDAPKYFKAGVELEAFGQVRTPDLDQERSSVGFGVNAFFTENIGVGVSTAIDDLNGSAVDNVSLRGIYRIPVDKNSLYGFAGAQRDLHQGEWAGELGVGVERRWAAHFGTFFEASMLKHLTGERTPFAVARAGVRIPF